MHFKNTLPLVALAAFVFGAGCYINVSENGPAGPDQIPEDCPCEDNSDCESAQYCLRGLCRPIPPGATTCSATSDCGSLETCINGICTERCAKDDDCSVPGCACEDNFCVGQPGTDGGTGGHADGGTGGNDGGTAACTKHTDCGVGAFCINAVCYLQCQSNTQCPAAEECKAGVCQPKPQNQPPACTTGGQCATGEDCVDGKCSKPCSGPGGCPTGHTCVIGYCTPSAPPQGSGQACTVSCECPSGESCVNGSCQL